VTLTPLVFDYLGAQKALLAEQVRPGLGVRALPVASSPVSCVLIYDSLITN
jgi:hypothetical protein